MKRIFENRVTTEAKSWLGLLVKIAFSALVLAFIVWQLDFGALIVTLSTISGLAVATALAVAFGQAFISAQRLVMVVARFGVHFRLEDSFRLTLEGMFFSQTFISFLGGDALRIWRVRQLGLSTTDATSAIVLDRLIGILVNHVLLLVSLPWLLVIVTDGAVRPILVLLALSGIGGFGLILLIGSLRGRGGLLHRLRARIPVRRIAMLVVEASSVGRHFFTQYRQLGLILFVSAPIALVNMALFAIILLGMGVDASLAFRCVLFVPAIQEIAMLPVSIAGWGVREGAAVVAFGALGLPSHQALAASFAYGLVVAAISLLGGVLWVVDRRQIIAVSKDRGA
jgi:glycosyltransferase 2 family protein